MMVYLLKIGSEGIYKIGVTKKVEKRIKELQTGNPLKIELINFYESEHSYKIEKFLHKKYSHTKLTEGFEYLEGEWFKLDNNDVKNFRDICSSIENNFKILKEMGNIYI